MADKEAICLYKVNMIKWLRVWVSDLNFLKENCPVIIISLSDQKISQKMSFAFAWM